MESSEIDGASTWEWPEEDAETEADRAFELPLALCGPGWLPFDASSSSSTSTASPLDAAPRPAPRVRGGASEPPLALPADTSTPAARKIWSMMSAFLLREFVSSDIAWAIARSSSRSFRSSTDRSSCCSAVISHLARLRPRFRLGEPGRQGTRNRGERRPARSTSGPRLSNKSPSEHRLGESGFESLSPATPRAYWGAAVHIWYRTPRFVGNNPTTPRLVPERPPKSGGGRHPVGRPAGAAS